MHSTHMHTLNTRTRTRTHVRVQVWIATYNLHMSPINFTRPEVSEDGLELALSALMHSLRSLLTTALGAIRLLTARLVYL